MEQEQRQQVNLRMLQRYGPWTEIIATATHVVLYKFQETAWTKAGTEGTLFFASPPSSLIILNRTSTENFTLNITGNLQIQHEQDYVILRVESIIYGLWFPSAEERSRMFDMVSETIQALRQQRPRAVSAPRSSLEEVGKLKAALGIGGGGPTKISQTTTTTPGLVQEQSVAVRTATTTTTTVPAGPQQLGQEGVLVSPSVPAAPPPPPPGPGISEPLDKRSLQLALLSLVQDERFLDLIHTQYLRVVQRRQDKNTKK